MTARPLLIPGFAQLLHGGDYNPDQWLGHPEIIEDDFRLMKLAGCEALHLRLEPEEDEPPMTGVVGR